MGGTHYFVFRQRSGRIFVTSLHFTSFEPRPSVPDFVSQLWRKIGGRAWKDFSRDTVAPWRSDLPDVKVHVTRNVRVTADGPREMQDHIQDSIVTWRIRTGLLFIKRSYSSGLEIPVVTVFPKHRSLWASRKCLQLKLSSSWYPQTPVLPRNIFLWCYNQFHHV